MEFKLNNDWKELLKDEFNKDYFKALESFLDQEYSLKTIYPPKEDIFNALNLSSYKDTKVVIIGQDPYHEPNQAHGLAFSVKEGTKLPPSLNNIYKEISSDLGLYMGQNGDLTSWGEQGVLLLNNVLTVEKGKADSHKKKGWEIFTDKIITLLNEKNRPVVFIFWGNNAKSKKELVTNPIHLVLDGPHPSPLSAYHGFFGCRHFSKCNEFLIKNGLKPIDWKINDKNGLLF
jgi:uracil-DNA glycosylase